jgi:hypothetical protein
VDVWRRYLRPGVLLGHVLVLAAALICLRLGWWQWDVSRESRGTVQNLGYALLWPVFAGSFIYMWLRFLHLEGAREADGVPETGVEVPDHARDMTPDLPSGTAGLGAAGSPDQDPAPDNGADPEAESEADSVPSHSRRGHDTPRGYTIAVATIGDDEDDPELAAYNQALAALAEQDERGAR